MTGSQDNESADSAVSSNFFHIALTLSPDGPNNDTRLKEGGIALKASLDALSALSYKPLTRMRPALRCGKSSRDAKVTIYSRSRETREREIYRTCRISSMSRSRASQARSFSDDDAGGQAIVI